MIQGGLDGVPQRFVVQIVEFASGQPTIRDVVMIRPGDKLSVDGGVALEQFYV